MSRVGEKIKNAREASGMSQKQLAKKLGVAESFVNDVELGRKIANEQFITKVSKVLNRDINDITMSFEDIALKEEKENRVKAVYAPVSKEKSSKEPSESRDLWNQAFGDVLKNVPIYDYSLTKSFGFREMPVHSNKIEGFNQDKIFYVQIQEDDMSGFRMQKDDIALCASIKEIENNTICLIEYNGERKVRQIKKLDNSKALLISNGRGDVKTETAVIKDIKPIGKLLKLEITL